MTNIYILRLEGGRYYVGKSDDVVRRYQQHVKGKGSSWTKIYRPISIEKVIENTSIFDEDKITKEYMSKHGVDKVRGGSYVEVELSEFQKDALNMEIWAANDCCTQCGRKGHFVKDCYASKNVLGVKIEHDDSEEDESEDENEEWVCSSRGCGRTFATRFGTIVHERTCKSTHRASKSGNSCYRCGREGHYSPDCYASKHINGYYL
jgi:predicted GIY-YIG superfamily endonuclease